MRTIYKTIESKIEIKKSRFISIIKNIQSIEEFNTCIEELKVKYPKATHYCYGYICGNIERFSDDGEPGGTAGTPILNVLTKENLNNICCVVIRYFGGIKLGAGGLIRAYSSSVSTALQQADKVVDVIFHQYSITYPYELSGTMENWLRRNTNVVDYMYDEQVTCLFETESKEIETEIQNLTSGKCTAEYIKDVKREKDI